jgi:hypothetical protein
MKRLTETDDVRQAEEVQQLLQAQGIEAFVFGTETFSTPGVNPLAYPSVWIADEADFDRAQTLVRRYEEERRKARPIRGRWQCARCGERHEAQFHACWRCGTPRPRTP